jgi:hypothetical protein
MKGVKKVKKVDLEACFSEMTCQFKKSVWLQPEVMSGEVINPGINEKKINCLHTKIKGTLKGKFLKSEVLMTSWVFNFDFFQIFLKA